MTAASGRTLDEDLALLADTMTEADIRRMVGAFYAEARVDDQIGPYFDRVKDWDAHTARLSDYWSALILKTERYNGMPAAKHMPMRLTKADYARWTEVWERVAMAEFDAGTADALAELGRKMARGMATYAPQK